MLLIKTARLTLREVTEGDLQTVHELHSLPETDRWNTLGIPFSVQETQLIIRDWLRDCQEPGRTKYVFFIEDELGQFIGLAGIKLGRPSYRNAEIWYKIHPSQWQQGYATETAKEMLKFCFNNLSLHRVEAGCAVNNLQSARVLEKIGMTCEGRSRQLLPIRGEWFDNFKFAILESDFLKS